LNGVQTRLKCKPNVKRCKRFVFAAHSPLLHPNTLKTKAIIHFQTDHILTRFVFPPLHIETEVENLKRLTNAYMNQDLNTMLKISEERKGDQCDALPGEENVLIYNRNKAWAEKLPAIMKAAPTFVAVGALHLPGEKGLLNLLKRQGYTVEAVK